MILKKPYAFLIKHFKLIHLILTAIYIFIAYNTSSILSYYNNFISDSTSKLNAINYINSYYLIAIALSIIICIIILILLFHKKKPKLLYFILIGIYIIFGIIINISIGGLNTIYTSTLDAKTLRLYRDMLQIILIIQYITITITLIRGLGFDIKKFEFVKDLNEMNIELTDDEEVELTLGGIRPIERKIRRRIRELKYYYIENKIFINIILIIIIVISLSTITIDKQVINKVYSENEVISTDIFNLQVLKSYITKKSSDNKKITSDSTSFIIVKLQITPTSTTQKLTTSNLILKINNETYTINNKYSANFTDIGTPYKNQKISSQKTYLFMYNIPDEYTSETMTLIYGENTKITLSPINLDEIEIIANLNLNDTIDLSETVLSQGYITITSYDIKNEYSYEYTYEINGEQFTSNKKITTSSNTIINLLLTSSLPSNMTSYEFLSKYGKIKYKIEDTEYTSNVLIDKTPGSYTEGLYLEVDKEIEQADSIYIELTIRNKQYIYTIK